MQIYYTHLDARQSGNRKGDLVVYSRRGQVLYAPLRGCFAKTLAEQQTP